MKPSILTTMKDALAHLYQRTSRWHDRAWWRVESALLLGALTLGLLSGTMRACHESALIEAQSTAFATVEVLCAATDMKAGELFHREKLEARTFLKSSLTDNFLRAEQGDLVSGRRGLIDYKKGDPLLLTSVQGMSDLSAIADKIPPGKRLFTLAIADSAANNGFLKPNDHVDILAHLDLPNRGLTTFRLLQDVTLISVGKTLIEDGATTTSAANVSFFIDASATELVAFAQNRGNFSLSLRNPKDQDQDAVAKHGVDMSEFLDHQLIAKASGGGALKVQVQKPTIVTEDTDDEKP